MATKKITLNELRSLVKQIIKEETGQHSGLKLKYKRPTDKEEGNIAIFFNDEEIGYMMPVRSKFAKIGDNYHIQFSYQGKKYIEKFSNKQKAIEYLKSIIN